MPTRRGVSPKARACDHSEYPCNVVRATEHSSACAVVAPWVCVRSASAAPTGEVRVRALGGSPPSVIERSPSADARSVASMSGNYSGCNRCHWSWEAFRRRRPAHGDARFSISIPSQLPHSVARAARPARREQARRRDASSTTPALLPMGYPRCYPLCHAWWILCIAASRTRVRTRLLRCARDIRATAMVGI